MATQWLKLKPKEYEGETGLIKLKEDVEECFKTKLQSVCKPRARK